MLVRRSTFRRPIIAVLMVAASTVYAIAQKAPVPTRVRGTIEAVDGDTLIMFVTWDRDGKLSSESIHQFGSATLDEHSSHYADQSPLFVAMKTKPILFTRAQLQGHIQADYRPGQRR